MAYSVLQGAANSVSSGNGSVTFTTANVSAGTKIICQVTVDYSTGGNPVSSVKDGAGNTWTLIGFGDSATNDFCGLYALDTPSGDVGSKPTLTATVSTNFGVSMVVMEVSGLLPGSTLLMVDGAGATATGTASPATTGTYITTTSGELLVFCYGDSGDGFTVSLPTGSTTYTQAPSVVNASSDSTAYMAYGASTGGAESASASISGSSHWDTFFVAFHLAPQAQLHPGPPGRVVTVPFAAGVSGRQSSF